MQSVPSLMTLTPDQSFYRPGMSVRLHVNASHGSRVEVTVMFRDTIIETLKAPLRDGRAEIHWAPPPEAPRGYGFDARLYDADGDLIAITSTAADVLNHWTQAPRYGFFSDFTAGRQNDHATRQWLLTHHLNAIQFYDWQYRWEQLLPPVEQFTEGLGRANSMAVIRRLIDVAHSAGTAAMPYTAIYGGSIAFFHEHPEWALMDAEGQPHMFGENFMTLFDPTPDSPWNIHLLQQYADVLTHTAFDGIHIDQYGLPKAAFNHQGDYVDLAHVMPAFIDQTAALVKQVQGERGAVMFNSVGNWPIDQVAPAGQYGSYIEVWPPYNDYADLHRIIVNAQEAGSGKPVILAAYIHPQEVTNWCLANAVIFASGASYIETGEPSMMLADPYFPKFGPIPADQHDVFRRQCDFMVRYENALSVGTSAASADRHALDIDGVRTRGLRSNNRVLPIVRAGDGFETFNLINFVGVQQVEWNQPGTEIPTVLHDVGVTIPVERIVERVWFASPDQPDTMTAHPLVFTHDGGTLRFTLPQLEYWNMIVVEYSK